jgi:hypothetical protein
MAFSFDSESPIRDILASKTIRPWGGSSLKRRKEMEGDITREQNQEANIDDNSARDAARIGQRNQAAGLADIEGESGPQRITRLQNQAWDPDSYGDKYRAQFKPLAQSPTQGAAPTQEDEYEIRKRRRMAQANDMNRDTSSYE